MKTADASTLPVLFVGHGNPMNVVCHNAYTRGWAAIGSALPRPKAILCISAHWYLPGTFVTAMPAPRTIHDFGGFPRELYEIKYPAPGDPVLAARVRDLLAPLPAGLDHRWGLDHGAWSVLHHMYPQADIPVVQLSLDETRSAADHYDLAKHLAPLRDEGILVIGSGNLVHNLHAYAWGEHRTEPYDWASRFEDTARRLLLAGEDRALVKYENLGRDAILSIPTPDHYLPLLYVLTLRRPGESIHFPVTGFDGGSISMTTVQIS